MEPKKKLLTSAVALGLAGVMAVGGTFAWQSINQTVINESSDINNPGGRLHNDLSYVDSMKTDSNVYVENFDTDEIFARVRLEEYMEVVLNYGTPAQKVVNVTGKKLDAEGNEVTDKATEKNTYDYEYTVHKFGGTNATDDYFKWNPGTDESEAVYMPTFNKNKDSLKADLNGLYTDRVGGISNRGEGQYFDGRQDYKVGDETTAWAIYDADWNTVDELGSLSSEQLNDIIFGDVGDANQGGTKSEYWKEDFAKAVKLKEEKHTAKAVGDTKGLISMDEWMDLLDGEGILDDDGKLTEEGRKAMYGYWVYDEDGWVYWSAPIAGGETTGLLLDGFDLRQVMDNTWYYAINVVGQFVTANDVGKANNTGFYATLDTPATTVEDGENETATPAKPVSDDAEKLLALIGVQFPADTTDDNNDDDKQKTDIIIRKGDTAATVTYTRTPGEYSIVAEGFTGDVTYKVEGANRGKITVSDKLTVSKWESAASFTVTATDSDGNTGTVTIVPSGTTPTDDPIFQLYKVVDGEEQYIGELTDGMTQDWKAGERYRVIGDFSRSGDGEYRISLGNLNGSFASADSSEIYLDETWGKYSSTIIRGYDPDSDGDEAAFTYHMVYVATTEAAVGKSYILSLSSNGNESDYDGVEVTVNVVAAEGSENTDESTAEEIIRMDAEKSGLKVTYKRQESGVYTAGINACEFKLKPEYNNEVVTDTSKLTLTVNVNGTDKATVTDSDFTESTEDGDGWLKCTVSDLFTDKTGEVEVTLTVTYKDGETELTTEAYKITFTQGGSVVG